MNIHSPRIDDIQVEQMTGVDHGPNERIKELWENHVALPYSQLTPAQTWVYGVVAMLAVVVAILAVVSVSSLFAANSDTVATPPAATMSVASPVNADSTSIAQQGINLLRTALERAVSERAEDRGMINTHSGEIKSVKEDLAAVKTKNQADPKFLKALQEDIDAIKKLMATPPVKLVPMS